MNSNPEVSVIIPTYNRAASIGDSIRSVLSQSFQNFEIIIVNDGSTDDTEKIISEISDVRIRLVSHESNRGAPAARNTGIQSSKGEFVAFLDSDDRWLPDKLQIQMDYLQKSQETGSCSTGYYKYQETIGFLASNPVWPEKDRLKHLLTTMDLSFGTTLLVRKNCFDKVGLFDENFPRHEDWDWVLRYLKFYQHHVIQQPLVEIIRSSGIDPEKIEKANALLVEKHHDQFYQFGNRFGRKVEAKRWIEVSQAYFKVRNTIKGVKFLSKAFLLNPGQTPGTFVALFDSIFGTAIRTNVKKALLNK
jgi:glycosyltransferase involved in cell wall biosynthesis